MSKRISHIVDVLKHISREFGCGLSTTQLRIDACDKIAKCEGITKNTVVDGITRQLKLSAQEFDAHCADWLNQNYSSLQLIVLQCTVDEADIIKVNSFFSEYYQDLDLIDNATDVINPTSVYREGRQKYVTHLRKERDRRLIRDAKAHWLNTHGNTIKCSVCSFCFVEKYGKWGFGFIEAHHTIPLSELEVETETTIKDLVPLCANCHRMIHRTRPWLTVEELKRKVEIATNQD